MTAREEMRRRTFWLKRADGLAIDVADSSLDIDGQIERNERRIALARAMVCLSKRQQEVLQLVFYHDLTIEDAARVMHISLGAARTHYERGKKFDALRHADVDSAPAFYGMWLRAKAASELEPPRRPPIIRWVALAASVVIGALLLFALERDKAPRVVRDARVPEITTWHSPTASLLRSPTQFLTTSTSVMSSVLDGVATTIPTRDLE
jgi:DNA-binding CsgD family transcriptional regulator